MFRRVSRLVLLFAAAVMVVAIFLLITAVGVERVLHRDSAAEKNKRTRNNPFFFHTIARDDTPRSEIPIYIWMPSFEMPWAIDKEAFDFFWGRFNNSDSKRTLPERRKSPTNSRLVHAQDSRSAWYSELLSTILKSEKNNTHNRKLWEWIAIIRSAQAVVDFSRNDVSAFGFAVGREPISSALVRLGVRDIVVSDMPAMRQNQSSNLLGNPEDVVEKFDARKWADSGQWADSLKSTWREEIIDFETYRKAATFRPVDMSNLPSDLVDDSADGKKFDIVFSSSSVEHLGVLRQVEHFLLQTALMLKPGGVAVHTTEMLLTSLSVKVELEKDFTMLRVQDVEQLAKKLAQAPYNSRLTTRDYDAGLAREDLRCDTEPFHISEGDHLKLFRRDAILYLDPHETGGQQLKRIGIASCHTSIILVIIKNSK